MGVVLRLPWTQLSEHLGKFIPLPAVGARTKKNLDACPLSERWLEQEIDAGLVLAL